MNRLLKESNGEAQHCALHTDFDDEGDDKSILREIIEKSEVNMIHNKSSNNCESSSMINEDNPDNPDLSQYELVCFTPTNRVAMIEIINKLLSQHEPINSFGTLENDIRQLLSFYFRLVNLIKFFNSYFQINVLLPSFTLSNFNIDVTDDNDHLSKSSCVQKLETCNLYIKSWLNQLYDCKDIIGLFCMNVFCYSDQILFYNFADSLEFEPYMIETATFLVLNLFHELHRSIDRFGLDIHHHWWLGRFNIPLARTVRYDLLFQIMQSHYQAERIEHIKTKKILKLLQDECSQMNNNLNRSRETTDRYRLGYTKLKGLSEKDTNSVYSEPHIVFGHVKVEQDDEKCEPKLAYQTENQNVAENSDNANQSPSSLDVKDESHRSSFSTASSNSSVIILSRENSISEEHVAMLPTNVPEKFDSSENSISDENVAMLPTNVAEKFDSSSSEEDKALVIHEEAPSVPMKFSENVSNESLAFVTNADNVSPVQLGDQLAVESCVPENTLSDSFVQICKSSPDDDSFQVSNNDFDQTIQVIELSDSSLPASEILSGESSSLQASGTFSNEKLSQSSIVSSISLESEFSSQS